MLTRDPAGELEPLAGHSMSSSWDGNGGRHCPSYVKGWDPVKGDWIERLYYAGSAENLWGPYTIGFLEWDGERWVDQPGPAFTANEAWEHGSVYEPNLIYHDGKWKMWYVAGANQDDYLVHGYAESADGVTGWSGHDGLRATRDEDVRFLCAPAWRSIRRDLRARVGKRRHAATGDRIVVVQSPEAIRRARGMERTDPDHDGGRRAGGTRAHGSHRLHSTTKPEPAHLYSSTGLSNG